MCWTRKIAAGRSAGRLGRKVLIVDGPPVEIPMATARISALGMAAGRTAGRAGVEATDWRRLTGPEAAAERIFAISSVAPASRFAETVPSGLATKSKAPHSR